VNYKLSRAVAILRAAHSKMAAAEKKWRPAAMADLELMGVKTGALEVPHPPRRRRTKAA
jgi:hypothetical protein